MLHFRPARPGLKRKPAGEGGYQASAAAYAVAAGSPSFFLRQRERQAPIARSTAPASPRPAGTVTVIASISALLARSDLTRPWMLRAVIGRSPWKSTRRWTPLLSRRLIF